MQWDIFCQVIDNHGDLGVCWRLAAQLGARGERVRLWVDDAAALAWMAPRGSTGVEVLAWSQPLAERDLAAVQAQPGQVGVEAFVCTLAPEFIAIKRHGTLALWGFDVKNSPEAPPAWFNLEYLTAEPYALRCHGLPSPVMQGPGAGLTKRFFYPGFSLGTGGLLRESDLTKRQAAFDRCAWLAEQGITLAPEEGITSLFCYEPEALGELLERLAQEKKPQRVLVTAGRAAKAVQATISNKNLRVPANTGAYLLSFSYLPYLTQPEFDHLLWASDFNCVRGEDSLVRALWAGKPFVWQIYPQSDGAHGPKLEAFLDWLQAPPDLRAFHRVWNGLQSGPLPEVNHATWQACVQAARERLLAQEDLATQLLACVSPSP